MDEIVEIANCSEFFHFTPPPYYFSIFENFSHGSSQKKADVKPREKISSTNNQTFTFFSPFLCLELIFLLYHATEQIVYCIKKILQQQILTQFRFVLASTYTNIRPHVPNGRNRALVWYSKGPWFESNDPAIPIQVYSLEFSLSYIRTISGRYHQNQVWSIILQ